MSAQEVAKKLSAINNCVYNVSVQNGKDAGQTVPHVHLHVCPDTLGKEVRKEDGKIRTEEEMSVEAAKYRTCFEQFEWYTVN